MEVHIPLDRLPELRTELVDLDTDYGSATPDTLRHRCRAGRATSKAAMLAGPAAADVALELDEVLR